MAGGKANGKTNGKVVFPLKQCHHYSFNHHFDENKQREIQTKKRKRKNAKPEIRTQTKKRERETIAKIESVIQLRNRAKAQGHTSIWSRRDGYQVS